MTIGTCPSSRTRASLRSSQLLAQLLSLMSLQGARFTPVIVPLIRNFRSAPSGARRPRNPSRSPGPAGRLDPYETEPSRATSPTCSPLSGPAPRSSARPRRHAPAPRSSARSPVLTQPSVPLVTRSPTRRPVSSAVRSPPAPCRATRQRLASSRSCAQPTIEVERLTPVHPAARSAVAHTWCEKVRYRLVTGGAVGMKRKSPGSLS